MPAFSYTALDKSNAFVKSSVTAASLVKARRQLHRDGFQVVNIRRETRNAGAASRLNTLLTRISRVDRIFFTRYLNTLLESGIPLDQALKITAEQVEKPVFKHVLQDMHSQVLQGQPLHAALLRHKKYFSPFFINLVKVGERSGKLHEVLLHALEQQEQDYELVSKVRGAMVYPAIIVAAAIVIVTFMMVFVVPKITGILLEYNVELPLTTRILIATSHFLATFGIVVIPLAVAFCVVGFRLWVSTTSGKRQWDTLKLNIPVFKNIVREFNLARISRAMSALLKSGVPVDQAFDLAASVSGNVHYQNSLRSGVVFIRKGIAMTEIFHGYPKLYPPLATRMVEVGERSGRIDHMFDRLATFYEKSVARTLASLSTIIEPFLLLLIGFIVGFLGLAILTPIWKFAQTV
ncbi:MAG: hypothetical protein A3B30_03970 [Candidatus Komeilibacteria bacterium RIFCSPLOWO2_01_FULL_52_15]|uniref:Type II secretion system protein GspF domain-containing protein n=2 Tax=Candidatus Komeiliibacteriota TaxID=1817908 RepID=A0A1G2BSD9_9BACT|nr:MAG: hypothetical protein A2677_00670 [Candidatus Komeilibacteria bacterium RIFCSPHIGHO2_01_FULL_52_14]OGY91320.1 MAG: hypothetical protein A3B30_03970 [Candidatus Komeilibacteria bacterium RIFCSPLOWO2_01_FULL_52_15]